LVKAVPDRVRVYMMIGRNIGRHISI
jgi:hypothetical protein